MIATAKEAHQVINEYRRVVASIKQEQDSLNRLRWSTINQAWTTIPFTDRQEAKRLIEEY